MDKIVCNHWSSEMASYPLGFPSYLPAILEELRY